MRIRLGCLVALALLIGTAPVFVQAIAQERPSRQERIDRRQQQRQEQRQEQKQEPKQETRKDETDAAPAAKGESETQSVLRPLPSDAVSEKQIAIGGKPLTY